MTSTVTLTGEQQQAADATLAWTKRTLDECSEGHPPVRTWFTLGGLAGTGKTTVMRHIADELRRHCRFVMCAPTGKAVSVLRSQGINASTTHSLFYTAERDEKHKLVFRKKEKSELCQFVDVIGMDEASMVNETVHEDLLSYGVPIIYVGDNGQLPPVGVDPGLMSRLDIELKTIHRQALDSPIIRLAHHVRTHGSWESWPEWESNGNTTSNNILADEPAVRRLSLKDPPVFDHVSQFIVSMNDERVALNKHFREAYQRKALLEPGERIICLKNNRRVGVFNGMILTVEESHCPTTATLKDDAGALYPDLDLSTRCFHNPKPDLDNLPWGLCAFDYAYAITAHKSQGSQFPSVTISETPMGRLWSRNRWLYTAITRAEHRVTLLTR